MKLHYAVIAFCLLLHSISCRAEPASGYVETVEYNAQTVGQKRVQRLWFQGANVRIENLIGDDVVSVSVGGENSWSTAPAAGRRLFENQPRTTTTALATYPAQIRRTFARLFGDKKRVGEEKINGKLCWKYSWHENEFIVGDIGMAAHDVTYWVYADEQFPLVLARETSFGGRQDLIELRLNTPIEPEIFTPPQHLTPVRAFQLPKVKFLIEFQEERASNQYGWKVQSSDSFEGDGEKVTRTYTQTTSQKNGEIAPFTPAPETLTYQQAEAAIGNRLQVPEWTSVKKTGSETKLGLTTDILENIIEGLSPEKFWVADHPVLGTITLFRVTTAPTDTSKRGIARLEFHTD